VEYQAVMDRQKRITVDNDVADYLTKLPDMKLLEDKLRQSIGRAKIRIGDITDE
jgi:hypothetical protein